MSGRLLPKIRQQIQDKWDEYEALWTSILEDGIKQSEFCQLDTKFARYLLLFVGDWLYEWYHPNGELGAQEMGDCFATLLLEGFNCSSQASIRVIN